MLKMAQSVESSDYEKCRTNIFNSSFFICNVCRLCANISDNVVPIFDKINEKGSIYAKLKKCLPSIHILENDIKPKQICLSCLSKLELCFSFIEMSLDTDCKFEAEVQNRLVSQIKIVNESFLDNKLPDLSWLQVKQPSWTEIKEDQVTHKIEQNPTATVMPEVPNQTSIFSQPISSLNQLQFQNDDNLELTVNKQDTSHILQNLVMQDDISTQDLIVLVELKCKDYSFLNSSLINKKPDFPLQDVSEGVKIIQSNELANFQTKIIDSNGNLKIINLADLDSKFNFDKITTSFVNDNILFDKNAINNIAHTVSALKSVETDILNNILKLDHLNSDNVRDFNYIPSKKEPNPVFSDLETSSTSLPAVTYPVTSMRGTHSSSRDFSCNKCGKHFTRRNRLNAHLARHNSERPHSCDKCDQRFITRWDLTLHLRIHSGIFSCEYCGKAFPAKGKLERHRRTHTGERPFPCVQCCKAFSEKRNLENHLKTHAVAEVRKTFPMCLAEHLKNGSFDNNVQQKVKCEFCIEKNKVSSEVNSLVIECSVPVKSEINDQNVNITCADDDANNNINISSIDTVI